MSVTSLSGVLPDELKACNPGNKLGTVFSNRSSNYEVDRGDLGMWRAKIVTALQCDSVTET